MTILLGYDRAAENSEMTIVCLGEHIVGRVLATGGKNNRPRYLFTLNPNGSFWKDAKTVEAALAALQQELDDWLQKAGLA